MEQNSKGNDWLTIIIALLVVIGGIFYLANEHDKQIPKLSPNATEEETKDWIMERIKKRIENGLQKEDTYEPIKWDGGYCKNKGVGGTVFSGIHIPDGDWETVRYSHIFQITNKAGAVSHFRKSITFARDWNIVDYSDAVKLPDDVLGLLFLDPNRDLGFYGFRNATDAELILWGEDIIRKYIKNSLEPSQQYVPIKWNKFIKATFSKKEVLDFNELTFSEQHTGDSNWMTAALYVVHKYRIDGPEREKMEKENVFFINPEGKLKVVPLSWLPEKVNEEFLLMLFTNY